MSDKVAYLLEKYRSTVCEIGVECSLSDDDILCAAMLHEVMAVQEVMYMRRAEVGKRGSVIKLID